MLTNSAFNEYYQTKLLPEVRIFEEYRKSQLEDYNIWKITRYTTLAIFGIIVFLYLAHFSNNKMISNVFIYNLISNDARIFLIINALVVILSTYAKTKMKKLSDDFNYASKNVLFSKIIAAFDNFKYYPLSGIDSNTVISSNLFKNFNQFESEDFIQGNYRGVDITFSEIKLNNLTYKEVINGNEIRVTPEITKVFSGLFIISDILKKFSSTVYVLPDSWLKLSNPLPSYLKRVILEDPEFENLFDVYSDNQIESRYLLTPSFMERLKSIQKKFPLKCLFTDQKLYLSIELNEEFLPSLKLTEEITQSRIKEVCLHVNMILAIIDDLKLYMNICL